MKRILIMVLSQIYACHCNGQSAIQIEDFKKTIQTTWNQALDNEFDGIYCMDEMVPDLKPFASRMWVSLKKNLKNGRIETLEYIPKKEMERRIASKLEDSDTYAGLLKTMNQPMAYGEEFVVQNLTVVGVMKIKITGDGDAVTKFHPVGIKERKLLFPGVKTTKKAVL